MKHPARWLVVASAIYGLALIWRYSFVVAGVRWFCPADDVWVTMGYARTWVETGYLLWHPTAQAVQGFSSWVWVTLLAALQLRPLPPNIQGLLVQLLGWATMVGTTYTVSRMTANRSLAAVAVALVGFNWPLWNLAVQGWEHSLVVLCVAVAMQGLTK